MPYRTTAPEIFPGAVQIVDLFHAKFWERRAASKGGLPGEPAQLTSLI
jgi:hypothetical protein